LLFSLIRPVSNEKITAFLIVQSIILLIALRAALANSHAPARPSACLQIPRPYYEILTAEWTSVADQTSQTTRTPR
jgi:hypothetical protein